ncbi:MAG TPA: hypothetical protein VMQ65_01885 [Candidatus Limnocylindria bacterium]|nr:hypothetical protein [Candidatus Limnocylindria bacterium]
MTENVDAPKTPATASAPDAGRNLPLPEGVRLVHIGPHKTGTTAVQNALWSARPNLREQGVGHAGRSRNPSAGARAVTGQPSAYSADKAPPMSRWRELVHDIKRVREPRAIISSEFLAWAEGDAIRRIVDDLDPNRIHVVVTLRSLVRVMPSMWQQNVQMGMVMPFEEWVRWVLDNPTRPFWKLERHDRLIERWAAVVGTERMTAVLVDDRDHGAVMRAFEALLGLRAGTLVAERDLMNRSLSLAEAEAVRAFNVAFQARNLPGDLHTRTMRYGAAQLMKRREPPKDEQAVVLPGWAYPEVIAIQREIVDNVRASGVAVIGDLDRLLEGVSPPSSEPEPLAGIPPDVVGSLGMALLEATGAVRSAAISKGRFRRAEPAEVTRVPTDRLLGAIAGRAWRASAGRVLLLGRRRNGAA